MWLRRLQEAYKLMELEPITPRGIKGEWDSKYKSMEYRFTTKQGNDVLVDMDYSNNELPEGEDEDYYDYLNGEDHCDISFKVNKSYNDLDRGSKERDPDILNGVLGIITDHVNEYKLSYFSFTAWSGEGDLKNTVKGKEDEYRQVAVKKLIEVIKSIKELENGGDELVLSWLKGINIYLRVVGLKDLLCFPIHEIDDGRLGRIVELRDQIVESIKRSDSKRIGGRGEEWMGSIGFVDEFLKELKKYKEVNIDKMKNRRASLYQKMIHRFLPNWVVTQPNARHQNIFLAKKGR